MQDYEYKAVPAPIRAAKLRGVKDQAERYAHAVSELLNSMAKDGWEYWRAEALPCTERKGLTGSVTVYHSLLVFRRLTADAMAARLAVQLPASPLPAPPVAPGTAAPVTATEPEPVPRSRAAAETPPPAAPTAPPATASTADPEPVLSPERAAQLPGEALGTADRRHDPMTVAPASADDAAPVGTGDRDVAASPDTGRQRPPPLSARTPPGSVPPLRLRRGDASAQIPPLRMAQRDPEDDAAQGDDKADADKPDTVPPPRPDDPFNR